MKIPPYHTSSFENYPPTHRDVHHNHDDCKYGKDIKPEHRLSGTGDKPLCKECQRLG